jgi:hypothetical protein
MKRVINGIRNLASRRSFLKRGMFAAGAAGGSAAFGQSRADGPITRGDVAILRFLAAAEIIETDLWVQYNELAGVQDSEVPGITEGSPAYMAALAVLDEDMAQYIHDNTEDEISHFQFINAFLTSIRADPVNLDSFRTLPSSSKASGARQIGRLTNLMQLTVDTSWWTRYRAPNNNPDLDSNFTFPQAIPALSKGQFPTIPRSDSDLTPRTTFRRSPIPPASTSLLSSRAAPASTLRSCGSCLASGPPRRHTSKPGRTRPETRPP